MKKLFLGVLSIFFLASCDAENYGSASPDGAGVGQGGSLARFTIINNHLYIVDQNQLKVFSLANPENPIYLSNITLQATVETVFPYNDSTLFIGSTSGMLIYDVSNPTSLKLLSFYQHVVACDPVVAKGNYAYVTLRNDPESAWCGRSINQLEIIDISDLSHPKLITEVPMINPKGLGIYGDTLLVCDKGVKVFNVSDPLNPTFLTADEDFDAVDIIAINDLMILVSATGLNQYRFKNGKLNYLSSL